MSRALHPARAQRPSKSDSRHLAQAAFASRDGPREVTKRYKSTKHGGKAWREPTRAARQLWPIYAPHRRPTSAPTRTARNASATPSRASPSEPATASSMSSMTRRSPVRTLSRHGWASRPCWIGSRATGHLRCIFGSAPTRFNSASSLFPQATVDTSRDPHEVTTKDY